MPVPHDKKGVGGMESVDFRQSLPKVRDQGERPTCLAFAVTAAHELAHAKANHLSEESLYWGCKRLDNDDSPGSTFVSAAGALDRWGQCLEETWPYDRTDSSAPPEPPEHTTPGDDSWSRGQLDQEVFELERVKTVLRSGEVVVLGLLLTSGFFRPDDGRIPVPRVDDPLWGGHAVLVAGYRDQDASLVVRNSWGSSWGDDGYALLPYEYFRQLGRDAWIVTAKLDT
jgi:C1A family cysteine protease